MWSALPRADPIVLPTEPETQQRHSAEADRDDVINVEIMREMTLLKETVNMLVAERDMEGPPGLPSSMISPPSYHSD